MYTICYDRQKCRKIIYNCVQYVSSISCNYIITIVLGITTYRTIYTYIVYQ
jgi:hypothetical protein